MSSIIDGFPSVTLSRDKPLVLFSANQSPYKRKVYSFLARHLAELNIPSSFIDKAPRKDGLLPSTRHIESYLPECLHAYYDSIFENQRRRAVQSGNTSWVGFDQCIEQLLPFISNENNPISPVLVKKNYFTHYRAPETSLGESIELETKLHEGKVLYRGIDFSPIIKASIARMKRRYDASLTNQEYSTIINRSIKSVKVILDILQHLEKLVHHKAKKIFIAGTDPYYIPNGIILRWVNSKYCSDQIQYIDISPGYKHYFGYARRKWICVKNLTERKFENSNRFTTEEFNQYRNQYDAKKRLKRGEKLISKAIGSINTQSDAPPEHLKKLADPDEPLYGIFPNMLYDRPLDDSTKLFDGIIDWLLETIDLLDQLDKHIVVKPHPAEVQPAIEGQYPEQRVKDILQKNDVIQKVTLLEADEVNSHELNSYLDLALVWRSSLALEWAFYNQPVLVSGPVHWQEHLQLYSPESMQDYRNMINNPDNLYPTERMRQLIADYINYRFDQPAHFSYFRDLEHLKWDVQKVGDSLSGSPPKIVKDLLKEMNYSYKSK